MLAVWLLWAVSRSHSEESFRLVSSVSGVSLYSDGILVGELPLTLSASALRDVGVLTPHLNPDQWGEFFTGESGTAPSSCLMLGQDGKDERSFIPIETPWGSRVRFSTVSIAPNELVLDPKPRVTEAGLGLDLDWQQLVSVPEGEIALKFSLTNTSNRVLHGARARLDVLVCRFGDAWSSRKDTVYLLDDSWSMVDRQATRVGEAMLRVPGRPGNYSVFCMFTLCGDSECKSSKGNPAYSNSILLTVD